MECHLANHGKLIMSGWDDLDEATPAEKEPQLVNGVWLQVWLEIPAPETTEE